MNEIGAWFAIPESELDDLHEGAGNSAESGPKRARVPHRLPFELCPFFGEMAGGFAQERRDRGERSLVNGQTGETDRLFVRFVHTTQR